MVIRWPGRTAQPEAVRQQFAHVIDIMPTILDAVGVPAPRIVDGIEQQPIDGISLRPTFTDPQAPDLHRTQFFAIWDNVGIYNDGWWAGTWPHSFPWVFPPYAPTQMEGRRWQLFDLKHDFSQSRDVALDHPEKLAELQKLFLEEATTAKALPIHRHEGRAGSPSNYTDVTAVRFVGPQARLPEEAGPSLIGRSFKLKARVTMPASGAEGVLFAIGGRFGGMSWYIQEGRPALHYNLAGVQRFDVTASRGISHGAHDLELEFSASPQRGGPALVTLRVDGNTVGSGAIASTLMFRYSLDETIDVGSDEGTPVTEAYPAPFRFTGTLEELIIEFAKQPE
jgi:arylsulfatase